MLNQEQIQDFLNYMSIRNAFEKDSYEENELKEILESTDINIEDISKYKEKLKSLWIKYNIGYSYHKHGDSYIYGPPEDDKNNQIIEDLKYIADSDALLLFEKEGKWLVLGNLIYVNLQAREDFRGGYENEGFNESLSDPNGENPNPWWYYHLMEDNEIHTIHWIEEDSILKIGERIGKENLLSILKDGYDLEFGPFSLSPKERAVYSKCYWNVLTEEQKKKVKELDELYTEEEDEDEYYYNCQ